MPSTILFSTFDRDECHRQLEEILAKGEYPKAECREADEKGNHTIWSGPQRDGGEADPVTVTENLIAQMDEAQLAKLEEFLATRRKAG